MKLKLLLLCVALLAITYLSQSIVADPGYVYIAYGDRSLEMSVATAGLLMVAIIICVYVLIKLVNVLWAPGRWARKQLLGGARSRAQFRTMRGVQAYLVGDYKRAHQLLLASVGNLSHPTINYLLAALSLESEGQSERANELLEQAAQGAREDETMAIRMIKAEVLQSQGHWEQSLATLTQITPATDKAIALKLKANIALKDWVTILASHKALFNSSELDDVESESSLILAVQERTKEVLQRIKKGYEGPESLTKAWTGIPETLRAQPACLEAFMRAFVELDQAEQAEKLIRPYIVKGLTPEVAYLYGTVMGSNPLKQYKKLKLVVGTDTNPMVLHSLARLSMRGELWGQAREYYKQVCDQGAPLAAYSEYSTLLRSLGEMEAADRVARQGIEYGAQPLTLPQPNR